MTSSESSCVSRRRLMPTPYAVSSLLSNAFSSVQRDIDFEARDGSPRGRQGRSCQGGRVRRRRCLRQRTQRRARGEECAGPVIWRRGRATWTGLGRKAHRSGGCGVGDEGRTSRESTAETGSSMRAASSSAGEDSQRRPGGGGMTSSSSSPSNSVSAYHSRARARPCLQPPSRDSLPRPHLLTLHPTMATRRRVGFSTSTSEASRRQLMQPVPCWGKVWGPPDGAPPGTTLRVYMWVKTDKKQVRFF